MNDLSQALGLTKGRYRDCGRDSVMVFLVSTGHVYGRCLFYSGGVVSTTSVWRVKSEVGDVCDLSVVS